MRIIDAKTMQDCEVNENTVVALGTFDGCHIGHMSVLRSACFMAKELKVKSIAYTFDIIPRSLFDKRLKSIMTLEEKIKFIIKSGVDYVAIEEFTGIMELEGGAFVENVLLNRLHAKGVVCGYDYRFGKNASNNVNDLKEKIEKNGGRVEICPQVTVNDVAVSSTLIREKIQNGQVEEILALASPYSVYAKVNEGKKLGRTIGIPTINQIIPENKISPKRGVYITECEIGEDVYCSVTNVGVRPTVENEGSENMETYIIGYEGNLYHSYIRVNFYKRIRDEIKFSSLEMLKEQLEKDVKTSIEYFK